MSKAKLKKVLAGMLAATMVLGMSATAFASETPVTSGTGQGAGSFEGHVDKNVLKVMLPTDDTSTFAYTMDPEGLIAATEGAKNKTATFEEGANVYFQSATNKYTKESAKLKVVNKGTVDADVTIKAETATNNDVTMADSSTFSDTSAKLYLGLKVANQTEQAVKTTGDSTPASVVVGLKGTPNNYEIQYDATLNSNAGGYKYVEKPNLSETAWNSFEFYLTGACNANGTWSAENLAAPAVTVTWSYAKRESDSTATLLAENATTDAAPSLVGNSFTMTAGQPFVVNVSLGAGTLSATGIDSVSFERDGSDVAVSAARYSFADNKITFESSWVDSQLAGFTTSRTYTIVFNDTAKTEVTFTITK